MKLRTLASKVTQRHKTALRTAFEDAINQQALAANISSQQTKKETNMLDTAKMHGIDINKPFAPTAIKIKPEQFVTWKEPKELADPNLSWSQRLFVAVRDNPGITSAQLNYVFGQDVSAHLSRLFGSNNLTRVKMYLIDGYPTYSYTAARKNFKPFKQSAVPPVARKETVRYKQAMAKHKPQATSVSPSPTVSHNAQQIVDSMPVSVAKEVYLVLAEYFGDK